MQMPETHYARAGDLRIAYQQWGEGPPLMFIPALISNIEISWEHELYRRNFEHFGRHMTCVQFDKRGIGLSDRFEGVRDAMARPSGRRRSRSRGHSGSPPARTG